MAFQQVEAQFAKADTYATAATSRADAFIATLQDVVSTLQAPNVDVDQDWPPAPDLAGSVTATVSLPATNFPADDTGLAPDSPDASFAGGGLPTQPNIVEYAYTPAVFPARPELDALSPIALPTAPETWVPPTSPALLNIAIRPFEGVNTHEDWVNRLSAFPDDLVLDAPSAFMSPLPNRYDSALLQAVTSEIRRRIAGGTGLAPEVEQAIWDRARSREAASSEAAIAEVTKNAESRGFMLPTGAFHAQLREAQKTLHGKTAELSRDIAMKQADLEQANVKHAIDSGISMETRLIEYVNNIEQRTFDAAKFAAQNAIEIYNAQVGLFRALLEKYNTIASVYRALIEGEKAKVEVYRAEVDAERAKVDINRALIDEMRAEIDIRNAVIAEYRAEIDAAQALLSFEKLKIDSFAERIRAYTAEINTETVKVEVFKAQTETNAVKAQIYQSGVSAYATALQANASAAQAKASIYDSQVRAFSTRVQAYQTRVGAEAEKVRAAVSIETLKLDGARLTVQQNTSNNQLQIENYRALLGFYESNKQISVSKAKVLSDNYLALKQMVADASKVGAQVNAQMAASAYGTAHVQASISGADQTGTSFSYSGRTSDSRAAPNY